MVQDRPNYPLLQFSRVHMVSLDVPCCHIPLYMHKIYMMYSGLEKSAAVDKIIS